jgi:cysteinyl-tRNA synthetase
MDDDFNTQRAIGSIFELVTLLNESRQKFASGKADAAQVGTLIIAIHELLDRLGLDTLIFENDASGGGELTESLIQLLIRTRQFAKENKQYKIADYVRDELAAVGIRLQDHPTGTIWLKD